MQVHELRGFQKAAETAFFRKADQAALSAA
jgi:hypothetical protein